MIDGLKHKDLILRILQDGLPHFSREFVDAGLLEYRRRITDLRLEGHQIKAVKMGKRPAYQLIIKNMASNLPYNERIEKDGARYEKRRFSHLHKDFGIKTGIPEMVLNSKTEKQMELF